MFMAEIMPARLLSALEAGGWMTGCSEWLGDHGPDAVLPE